MKKLNGLTGFNAWSVYNKVVFSLVFLRKFNQEPQEIKKILVEIDESDDIQEIKNLSKNIKKEPILKKEKL